MIKMITDMFKALRKNEESGITFIKSGCSDLKISYAALYKESLSALAFLNNNGLKPGMQVVFQIKEGEDFVVFLWACILGGMIPVPLKTVSNYQSKLQLIKIWETLERPYLLTYEANAKELSATMDKFERKRYFEYSSNVILIDHWEDCEWQEPELNVPDNEDTILLLYTSGSTSDPKAVIITNDKLMEDLSSVESRCKLRDRRERLMTWMPLTHVTGLILMHFFPLFIETDQIIMESVLFAAHPELWLQKAAEYRATILCSPNTGLKYAADAIKENRIQDIDLSSIRAIYNIGEPISVDVCNYFSDVMLPYHLKSNIIVPLYGMTEATMVITTADMDTPISAFYIDRNYLEIGSKVKFLNIGDRSAAAFVSVGKPLSCCTLVIHDEDNQVLDDDIIGRIKVKGKVITKGYYCDEAKTAETISKDGWLDTGDLGFCHGGELIVTGRKKDIIFVNGQNYYPQDVEEVAKTYAPANERNLAVCTVNIADKMERPCLFLEHHGSIREFIDVSEGIKEIVNEKTGLPLLAIVPVKNIPITSSGKINRHQLGRLFEDGYYNKILEEVANAGKDGSKSRFELEDEVERKLQSIWREVLHCDEIDRKTSLFKFGVSSLQIMKACSMIEARLGVNVSLPLLFEYKTIENQAEAFKMYNTQLKSSVFLKAVPDPMHIYDSFPLTGIQTAYLLGRSPEYELGGVSTHVFIEINTELDLQRLNRALTKLIYRHPMMRTIFKGNHQQIIEKVPPYRMEIQDLRGENQKMVQTILQAEIARMSHYIFDPSIWPLFEFKALKYSEKESYLLIGFDMLIIDAASIDIIASELMEFYSDESYEKELIEFSYRDYILAYKTFKDSSVYERDKNYWSDKMDNFPPVANLPLKSEIGNVKKPHFKRIQRLINKESWEKIKREALGRNVTPSSLLCTVYMQILSEWCNQPELSINLTISNRYPFHKDVDKLVGDFTSVLPLGADFTHNEINIWERTLTIQNAIMEGLEHRSYEGLEFVRELSRKNGYGNKAILPVVFTSALSNEMWGKWNKLGHVETIITQTSQVYLDYQASESEGALMINWDYVPQLLADDMIQEMFDQYADFLISLGEGREDWIPKLSAQEKALVDKYNDTDKPIPIDTLHGFFIEQAQRTPDNIAVIDGDYEMSYGELDEKSGRIAQKLFELGVKDGDLVGVYAKRCKETIVNIIGILKAGGGYVPIDPQYPEDRTEYILKKSKCSLMLVPEFYENNSIQSYPEYRDGKMRSGPDKLAYVIYTSGSTGKPKGVMVTHGAAANTIMDINQRFKIGENDRILGISSMCFDLSVYDIFGALSAGAALVQIKDQRDVKNIYDLIIRRKITIWNSVPAIMDMMLQYIGGGSSNQSKEIKTENEKIEEEIRYYWSPAAVYDGDDCITDYIHIRPEMIAAFPDFYFFMQRGAKREDLYARYMDISKQVIDEFMQELIDNDILVSSILNPHSIFKRQEVIFNYNIDERIKYNPVHYEKFKKNQLERRFSGISADGILLNNTESFSDCIENRSSIREFNEKAEVPFEVISQFLSVFKQRKEREAVRYYYPSAGGLYPIDVFLYVKEGRVENLKQGIYYYNPMDNCIYPVDLNCVISDDVQYYTNKSIFNSSAFTVYFIYNSESSIPKYGSDGYLYACIEAGIMIGLMGPVAEQLNLGTCSIGTIEFGTIRKYFKLNENQVLINSIEVGLKKTAGVDSTAFTAKSGPVQYFELLKSEEKEHALRVIMLSGDYIPLNLPDRIKKVFRDAQVISLGGATEAAIWSIYYPIKECDPNWKTIPYGMPLFNQKFYVLDYKGNLCHVGVPGELYIGGAGLADGYMYDPDKTEQSFICHPELGPLYRTGDYGVLLREGYIEFLGRRDQQVKIRGYRIELGEIENCLIRHKSVKHASVVDYKYEDGKKFLCAYIISQDRVNTVELRDFLSKELPDYMIPSIFMQVKNIPLTPNGKVDKKSLPKPQFQNASAVQVIEAKDEVEDLILNIWKEVLVTDSISVTDNFFDIGGDSMLLLNVFTKLDILYPQMLKITDLFTNTSVSKLADFIKKRTKRPDEIIQVSGVILPLSYFETGNNTYLPGQFIVNLEPDMEEMLNKCSAKSGIKPADLLAAIYCCIFNQISGEDIVTVQIMTDGNQQITSARVDFNQLQQFNDLLFSFKSNDYSVSYMLSDISRVRFNRSPDTIIPAFIGISYNHPESLLKKYDFIMIMQQESDKVRLICLFNGAVIKAEKAKELFSDYLKLVKAYIKSF